MEKKTIITLLIITALAMLLLTGCKNKPFDIGANNNCPGDYINIPDSPICNSDSQCISSIIPPGQTISPGTSIRCNEGTCQFKTSDCSGRVGQ